jgi:hypothetical protein
MSQGNIRLYDNFILAPGDHRFRLPSTTLTEEEMVLSDTLDEHSLESRHWTVTSYTGELAVDSNYCS